ncbi:DUF2269 family protein [Aquabacterium sp. J223]|uniref:DUF2269 family protein n=1 Tax=Aquabacterium sp. J223 TaxID=2898431 RepID=UPI0021AE210F|nr:DUF2269 domain-containing protein [Aquabacterium sp. J223]UUX94323.1 DUF2269 domain-containing protein [Aquabacterium sp. J223]
MEYQVVKWLHILSSTLLFGTGLGSAYYMWFASRTRDPRAIAVVVRYVVMADWLFTTTTIVFQPLSGLWLLHLAQIPWTTKWIMWTFALYLLAGACWLPVVWLQLRMRDIAQAAVREGRTELPAPYWRYLRIWFWLGWPAFIALVIVFWLMVAKPV